jgi:hypothetical protein
VWGRGGAGEIGGMAWHSPEPLGSGRVRVLPSRSAEPTPVSLARLLWLPESWLGG